MTSRYWRARPSPGAWPPVALHGRLLYDGGVVANVPMRQAQDMGACSLVVLDCAFAGRLPDARDARDNRRGVALHRAGDNAGSSRSRSAAGCRHTPVVYLPGPEPRPMVDTRLRSHCRAHRGLLRGGPIVPPTPRHHRPRSLRVTIGAAEHGPDHQLAGRGGKSPFWRGELGLWGQLAAPERKVPVLARRAWPVGLG